MVILSLRRARCPGRPPAERPENVLTRARHSIYRHSIYRASGPGTVTLRGTGDRLRETVYFGLPTAGVDETTRGTREVLPTALAAV
jgi:hypothetical protein